MTYTCARKGTKKPPDAYAAQNGPCERYMRHGLPTAGDRAATREAGGRVAGGVVLHAALAGGRRAQRAHGARLPRVGGRDGRVPRKIRSAVGAGADRDPARSEEDPRGSVDARRAAARVAADDHRVVPPARRSAARAAEQRVAA